MPIPIANLKPALEATEPEWRARLAGMFDRGQFILGDEVAAFEREFAAAMGAKFSVGVGTGTSALELCLRAGEVSGEVLTDRAGNRHWLKGSLGRGRSTGLKTSGFSGLASWRGFPGAISRTRPPFIARFWTMKVASTEPE